MLQTQTVKSGTLSILRDLMTIPELNGFALVGGTALSLLYGHRTSIDLDLFSTQKFERSDLGVHKGFHSGKGKGIPNLNQEEH